MDRYSYRLLNLVLAGITGALFLYAGFFYDSSGAVQCVYRQALGRDCATCGVTRSFHAFLTGHWQEGLAFNAFGLPLFLFFALQFFARVALVISAGHYAGFPGSLPRWDAALSATLFLVTFGPLIAAQA
ncbi:MAG: DUF2752 domain-containing protein [Chitinophagaceae bacterium]|nr:MAG: DUF2752 domain-containing protein [Chitinophagaceae bacterium]